MGKASKSKMEGMMGHDHAHGAAPGPAAVVGYADLFDFIDPAASDRMNQKDEHPWVCMVKAGDDDAFCESNVDEQLLVNIAFRERIKLHGVIFKGVPGKEDEFPRDVQIFVNTRLGFEDVDSQKPAQVLDLDSEDVADGKEIPTNFVRFQNVSSISIFVERNAGGADTTIINRIQLIGSPIAGTDMNNLKKVG